MGENLCEEGIHILCCSSCFPFAWGHRWFLQAVQLDYCCHCIHQEVQDIVPLSSFNWGAFFGYRYLSILFKLDCKNPSTFEDTFVGGVRHYMLDGLLTKIFDLPETCFLPMIGIWGLQNLREHPGRVQDPDSLNASKCVSIATIIWADEDIGLVPEGMMKSLGLSYGRHMMVR